MAATVASQAGPPGMSASWAVCSPCAWQGHVRGERSEAEADAGEHDRVVHGEAR